MFYKAETSIPGLFKILPEVHSDSRGMFVKTFQKPVFEEFGINSSFPEEFLTTSKKNVIRGMHFQVPPDAQSKIVNCVYGEVYDVVLDIRNGSPTFGKSIVFILKGLEPCSLFIPPGLAHGFCVLSSWAVLSYKVSSLYSPKNDLGIHWKSINVDWPTNFPIVSDRDKLHPSLQTFKSPFTYEPSLR